MGSAPHAHCYCSAGTRPEQSLWPPTISFTSESASGGHPDKVADQISDAVLDAILEQDPRGRVACETLVKTGVVVVAGEVTTNAWVDIDARLRAS